jgi:hypothetical protein
MGIYLNPGNEQFRVSVNSELYVDKVAIVHNDFSREIPPVFEIFSDRMEFTSYGGLIYGLVKKLILVLERLAVL